jgi:nitroreductase
MDINTPPARVPAHDIPALLVDRWSPRAFSDAEITETELLAVLEGARWAPSGYNGQPWRFVYALRGDAGWAPLLDALMPYNAGWASKAAALILIASYELVLPTGGTELIPNTSHSFDTGAAWAQLALAAHAAGWATHAMAGYDRAQAATATALPPNHSTHCIIALGKRGNPAQLPEPLQAREHPSPRKPLAETAFRGTFPE